MRLSLSLLMAFSLFACASIQRPDIDLMIINAPGNKRCGYNFERDYGDDGRLKSGAKMFCRPNKLVSDLNKGLYIDSKDGPEEGIARLKAYIKTLREEGEKHCE